MNLTNSWMNNPTFLAQSAHFFGAVAFIMTLCHFAGKPGGFIAAGVLTVAAAVKEFWYDLRYELPKQTLGDSGLDFGFYMLGTVLATVFVAVK